MFELPTPEEEAKIRKGIVEDPDAYEFTDEELVRLHPVGRPEGGRDTKEPVTIRLSAEVTALFRATGKGWQTRMDELLKEYVESHRERLERAARTDRSTSARRHYLAAISCTN